MKAPHLFLVVQVFAYGLFGAGSQAADPLPPRPTINVKDFGAKGDCQRVTDGAIRKGSSVLTSASAHFAAEDVGKSIYVLGASVQKFPELGEVPGAPLGSHIAAVTDAHTITLADAAQCDSTGAGVTWGTDDSHAIQRAIDSLKTTGGTVFFPAGMYRVVYQGGPGMNVAASNIHLQGMGNESAIFNSTVIFHAKMKEGVLRTEQAGVPVLYVGKPGVAIENVEVDHLWLGDNGQNYDYAVWGPHGPAVIGSAGKIDHFSFHDLTVATGFLCGVGTNSESTGFSIHHVTVLCTGEHGFYLAGTGSDGDVHDNRVLGDPKRPMRMGIAIKKKDHLRVTHNEVANVEFQGISVVGDDPTYTSHDVLIADNWIHDLPAWHTDAITIFNAENVIIRHNRIADTSWIGINLRTSLYTVSNVVVQDNIITRAGNHDAAFGIAVHYDPPPNHPRDTPFPGSIQDITIEGNIVTDCGHGISVARVNGHNIISGNRVECRDGALQKATIGYSIDSLPESTIDFRNNTGINCAKYIVAPKLANTENDLR
ncbi:MAG: right-handed parallel beta-helix repeat-containing protein [Chthoniobacter sp.]|uniref:right-handed parallel beta-helix repeat-containing protein n=1 Tax=Chthoniobacter sp. TaxID=2510640 RepID=UPI0032A49C32